MSPSVKSEYTLLGDLQVADLVRARPTKWHWYGHAFSLILILLLAWTPYQLRQQGQTCISQSEAFYSDVRGFVETEVRIVHPKGDHSWTGAPNDINSALWNEMSRVGTVSLDDDEFEAMKLETAEEPLTGHHFVIPQVFHNLHCLKLFRDTIWQNGSDVTSARHGHIDHCIENIRYTSMCAGDLSPITFYWDAQKNKHQAKYDLPRQCRKWDPIWDWASSKNLLDKLAQASSVEHNVADGEIVLDEKM